MHLKAPKVYRDPVHGFISYERDELLGRLVATLVDSAEFQRLRFIRQVGLANLVFHGAEHSRFSHSMGVAHLARRMYDQLHPDDPVDDERRITTVLAGLLHDVGHGPFSHAMERVFGFHHEAYSQSLICDPDTEIGRVLRSVDPSLPEQIAHYLHTGHGAPSPHYTADIVSSQIDADRCDYLLRDSLMTGVEVGRYDLERILLMLEHDERGLIVNVRAFESIEGYLIARYHMYRLVYFHRAVRAAEAMLQSLFRRALALQGEGRVLARAGGPLGRLMAGETLDARTFASISEVEAWGVIRRWADDEDPLLAGLARGLVGRRLYRAMERSVRSEDDLERVRAAEERVRASLPEGDQWSFLVDVARDDPYRPYIPATLPDEPPVPVPSAAVSGKAIRIRDRDGSLFSIEERSPLVGALARASYTLRRWCYTPALDEVVRAAVADAGLEPVSVET